MRHTLTFYSYTSPNITKQIHHEDSTSSSIAAAIAYFESRPIPSSTNRVALLTHSITLTASTQPRELPYPEPHDDFAARGLSRQDWATFINYVLPNYVSSVNNEVADRKMQAEVIDERMHRLTLQGNKSRTDLEQVKAQLEPLRSESGSGFGEAEAKSMVELWNEGFFGPRGIEVKLNGEREREREREERMPGAWIPYDHELPGGTPNARVQKRGWTFGGLRADSRGFKMGPIEADNSGFRLGNMLM